MLSTSRGIAAPAASVWAALVDTSAWPKWGPSITAVEPAEGRIELGSRGRVRTVLGVWLPYEITELEAGSRWAWSVAGVRATAHRVEALDARRCRASFDVPTLWFPYLAVCRVALARLARLSEA